MAASPVSTRDQSVQILSSPTSPTWPNAKSFHPGPSANPRFTSGSSALAASNSAPLTPHSGALLLPVDEEPNTPSSTIVEFGDLNLSRTESRSSSKPREAREIRESREGRDAREQSRSRGLPQAAAAVPRERSQSTSRRSSSANPKGADSAKGLADERINRFLQSMAQQAAQQAETEMQQENRSLYQRIAALQRTELRCAGQHQDRRARQKGESLRRKETEYEARIQELSEQLLQLSSTHPHKAPIVLSNEDISAWFDDQDIAWNSWSRAFGHEDPKRLSGLHPLQLQDLCKEVKTFVRMTDTGGLPSELLEGGKEAVHTLLNGMLANFICAEILASPFWVFVARSIGTLESPGIVPAKPLPGITSAGFRMDMNAFSNVAPLRPGPTPTPKSPQFPPPLITSMMPPSASSASQLGLPVKSDMERLVHMLTDAQEESARVAAHHWRAQMMRLFADGGFSLKDVAAAGRNDSRRTFVESRLNYARKLKERFLGGAARYLLQDQDSPGIERLERMLANIIDDALRFSCSLWTRVAPLRLHSWQDLNNKEFISPNELVTWCHAQAPARSVRGHESGNNNDNRSPSPQEESGRPIVMIVHSALVTDNLSLQGVPVGTGADDVVLVWPRARVMVTGPMSPSPSGIVPTVSPPPPRPENPLAKTQTPTSTTTSSEEEQKVDTPKSLELLPGSLYKASNDTSAS
ncbi:hypothetical protein C8A03DRAFT_48211 [Achaetomium macrosporum]|uniref:Uncharacterized protein n=1 Tax=Achaetomium macrosporum TaxID=79813 RepID=A0AAN7C0V5_9PEZI|nr:hypothetical protein C8A03DRAFT_48211 [Achaetomium macrosporum]